MLLGHTFKGSIILNVCERVRFLYILYNKVEFVPVLKLSNIHIYIVPNQSDIYIYSSFEIIPGQNGYNCEVRPRHMKCHLGALQIEAN